LELLGFTALYRKEERFFFVGRKTAAFRLVLIRMFTNFGGELVFSADFVL
jgi:hypothetical protein